MKNFLKKNVLIFIKRLLKLINYPIDKYIIKRYDNHPDGPIKTYLEWQVIKNAVDYNLTFSCYFS